MTSPSAAVAAHRRVGGWGLTLAISAALVLGSALTLALEGTDESALRMWIRSTARSSVALFLLAFIARPLRQLWQAPASAWLLAQRRYLGVSVVVSHTLHAIGIGWLARAYPGGFEPSPATLVVGGTGYLLFYAMAATSSDAAVAWLGRRRWTALHRTGMWWNWFVFTVSFLPEPATPPEMRGFYVGVSSALLAAAALRPAAWWHTRHARRAARAHAAP